MKNPVLAHLTDLAALDEKLQRIDKRRREQEEAVRATESALAAAGTHLADRHKEVLRLRKEADALNLEVGAADSDIERLEGQLLAAKSNKEYDILRREVDGAKEKRSGFEDEGLERFERADVIAEEEAAAKTALEEAGRSLEEKSKAAASVEVELAKDEASLRQEREAVASKLDQETRHTYERLLEHRHDSAMARVVDGTCMACSRKLTPQLNNLVTIGEEIVECMGCQRIFYLDDETGP